MKEVILNKLIRIYHIDHDNKFNDRLKRRKPPFEELLSLSFAPTRVSNKMTSLYRKFVGDKTKAEVYGIPTIFYSEYLSLCRDMVAGKRSYIFNDDTWGLAQESLEEFTIRAADWDKRYEKN